MNENTKITLTISQLRRLVRESDESFKPTIDWMKRKYEELNERLFEGKLGGCNFDIFTSGRGASGNVLGSFSFLEDIRVNRNTGALNAGFPGNWIRVTKDNFVRLAKPVIKLNGNYSGAESVFENTLLHEMCHYYTYRNGIAPVQAHGREFKGIAMLVSMRSHGEFDIKRLATAEEMSHLKLDADVQAKNDARMSNRQTGVIAVLVYTTTGEKRLTLTKDKVLASKIALTATNNPAIEKTIVTSRRELTEFLFSKGFKRVFRTWRWWEISGNKNIQEIESLFNKGQRYVTNKGDTQGTLIKEDMDDANEYATITPDVNLGIESPMDL